ncbi:MAG: molecular chaperone DnaJ [Pirellulaceae bacterium]|nr:molecular chaperone DnaJ [Pirellulaceae bacterium]
MSGKRDYYEVLEVTREASEKEITRAYRRLAVKYHPDSNIGNEEVTQKFKEAAEAFEVLGDTQKRARYDRYGHAGVSGASGGGGFHDVSEIFEAFGDIFGGGGSPFGDIFGGSGRGGPRRHRGADIRCEVTLTLEEAAEGITKTVHVNRHKACEACEGSGCKDGAKPISCSTCSGLGQVVQSAGILRVQTTCPTCQGTGEKIDDPCLSCRGEKFIQEKIALELPIPAGIDDGMKIRLTGEGEPSPDGGPAGDCYCFVHVKEHAIFKRDGRSLVIQVPISYSQAALGTTIEIATLNGPHKLTIPMGTQSGELFRVQGKGVCDPRGGRKGDLLVHVYIEVPKKPSTDQEKLLRELAELEHNDVTPERKSFLETIKNYFTTTS